MNEQQTNSDCLVELRTFQRISGWDLNSTTFSFPWDALTEVTLFYGIIQQIKAQHSAKDSIPIGHQPIRNGRIRAGVGHEVSFVYDSFKN